MLLMIPLEPDHLSLLDSSLEVLAIPELYLLCILLVIENIVIKTTAEKGTLSLPLLPLRDQCI